MKYFATCPADIQAAFPMDTVLAGWRKAGLCPIDLVLILSKWPGFAGVTTKQAANLLETISTVLVPYAREHGYIDNELLFTAIEPVLPKELDKDQYQRAKTKILPRTFNRWRCVWINNKGTLEKRQAIAIETATKTSTRKRSVDTRSDEFTILTVAQLKERCKVRGFSTSGNKPQLLGRLRSPAFVPIISAATISGTMNANPNSGIGTVAEPPSVQTVPSVTFQVPCSAPVTASTSLTVEPISVLPTANTILVAAKMRRTTLPTEEAGSSKKSRK